ncbi:MAG: acetyl-CoA carboxylase biotin carboxyl carrier protein subunit [Nitrososphaeraceae archaeon]
MIRKEIYQYGDSNTKIQVNNTLYDIEVNGELITFNGKEIDVKLSDNKITIEGNTFNIDFTEEGDPSTMIINGMLYLVSKENSIYSSVNEIKTPMNGRIINILVNEGDWVNNGQILVMLEAMKMQNQIRSPRKGTIKSIKIVKDQSVKLGDILLTFE